MAKKKLIRKHEEKNTECYDESSEVEGDREVIAEYEEILYTNFPARGSSDTGDQRIWRDVDSIEKNIDKIDVGKSAVSDKSLDDTVDKILEKSKKSSRKPANVVYVVSRPQPGQVRGDWAVRTHHKIFSHHRTKEKAIDTAREIARDRGATVLVQNTDGTFSDGFKPKPKK